MESISRTIYSLYQDTPFHGEWIVACLSGAWNGILGARIARTCKPVAWRNYELVVEVLETDWLPVLTGMKQELLQRICQTTGGEVRHLVLK